MLGFTAFALRNQIRKRNRNIWKNRFIRKAAADLVNDTLELSRIESGKAALEMEKVMPCDLIPAVITALQPSAELKNIRMIADFPMDDHIPVYCDRLKVQKIALNLISMQSNTRRRRNNFCLYGSFAGWRKRTVNGRFTWRITVSA